jgi:hypothetical protein
MLGRATAEPGEAVTLSVTLACQGESPAALDGRILFDPSRLSFQEIAPGKTVLASGHTVSASLVAPGVLRFVVEPSGSLGALQDGEVALLHFTVQPSAQCPKRSVIKFQQDASAFDAAVHPIQVQLKEGFVKCRPERAR